MTWKKWHQPECFIARAFNRWLSLMNCNNRSRRANLLRIWHLLPLLLPQTQFWNDFWIRLKIFRSLDDYLAVSVTITRHEFAIGRESRAARVPTRGGSARNRLPTLRGAARSSTSPLAHELFNGLLCQFSMSLTYMCQSSSPSPMPMMRILCARIYCSIRIAI